MASKKFSRKKRRTVKKIPSAKAIWESKFQNKLKTVHSRNIESKTKKLLKKIDRAYRSLVIRSRKIGVPCTITIEDLREKTLIAYGTPCKYSNRILTISNIVYDHIIPISKHGPSSKDNIQVISKFANNIKSNLSEDQFKILLGWINVLPENIKNYVSVKLAGGRYASVKEENTPEQKLIVENNLLH